MDREKLHDALVDEFQSKAALDAWVRVRMSVNVDTIMAAGLLDQRITELLQWADGEGKFTDLLQALADFPPSGGRSLPAVLFVLTGGAIAPTTLRRSGLPPVTPTKDWFVTSRPFANRDRLRTHLETLDTAVSGPDSVLVIEGDLLSGKSYSVRFAAQCAPQDRFVVVDIAEWGDQVMNAADLAQAIDPQQGTITPFDPTKEDEAVPRIMTWLVARLRNTKQWIIVDHCSRSNLSAAAESLLLKLASQIDRGFLPGVRLILADIDRARLSDSLRKYSRYDRAALPDRKEIGKWCKSLAAALGKPSSDADVKKYVDEVFDGLDPVVMAVADFVNTLEDRLNDAVARIQSA